MASGDELAEEAARARETAAIIQADWPLIGASPVTDFVRALGKRLGEHANAAPFPWEFEVFRHRSANALAIGGGRLYVSDGTIHACRSEAELAAILAHEMGHQLAGHFRRAGPKATARIRIGSVTQELDPAKEMEADRLSIGILRGAGYAPRAALDIAKRLSERGAVRSERRSSARLAALASLVKSVPQEGTTDSPEFQRLREELTERP
jgi:predicted Zn-dependent protease